LTAERQGRFGVLLSSLPLTSLPLLGAAKIRAYAEPDSGL
jgi:hypothetical protein